MISPCTDDGFEDFRGWLVLQGRSVFDAAIADPDSLAGVTAVQTAVAEQAGLGHREALHIAAEAYEKVTGEQLPDDMELVDCPQLDTAWWHFDLTDRPRLTALRRPYD